MSRPSRRKKAAGPIKVEGDLTIYTAASVQQLLLGALGGSHPLELDLGEVADFDSAGVQQVLGFARECEALGRPLRIVAASESVHEVFGLFGLDSRLALPAATA